MKIGILSMQRIFNYGSFLQAYGLKCLLEETGNQVEFVDYAPGPCLIQGESKNGLFRKVGKVFSALQGTAPLAEKIRFIQYKRHYAAKYFPYLGITDAKNLSPELDLLVIGSDEVFNCVQSNTNVGFTPALFGQGIHAKRRISYAASFGNTTIGKLEQHNVNVQVAQWLKELDCLSVRDKNSAEVSSALTGHAPLLHLDPVLAYPFVEKCDAIPKTVPQEDYMILYGYSGRFTKQECKQIRNFAKKRGLKILCIGGIQNECDQFVDCNPFEVIAYFQHATCVITDTFHGTILSTITQRPFVSVVRSEGYGNSQKLTDLLDRLELRQRQLYTMDALEQTIDAPIDYEKVAQILAVERKRSREYLQEQIRLCTRQQTEEPRE